MQEKESVKNARIFNRKMPYAGRQLDLKQLLDNIGNPTDKQVGFFKITLINELVRCDFLNQPKWSE